MASQHELSHVKLVTPAYRQAGNAEVFDTFNLPGDLFFQGELYHLDYKLVPAGSTAELEVTFAPQAAHLVPLTVQGDNLVRLVLDNGMYAGGYTVVLDHPGREVLVPAAFYERQLALLQGPGFTNWAVGVSTNFVQVSREKPLSLRAGGPLRHHVDITPNRGSLSLQYQLVNDGGMSFFLTQQNSEEPPKAILRQGSRPLALVRFEFG